MGTEAGIMDTPETDAVLRRSEQGLSICDETIGLCRRLEREWNLVTAIAFQNARRLEGERDLALAIARKYYNGPELTNFPNVKV